MLGSSEWRMPLNVLILEFFSLYFHFSSFLRGKIDTNKRLCLVFRNVLTFRIEIDESKKTFCDIKMPVVCCARAGCWRQVLHIFRFGEYKLLYESLLILSQTSKGLLMKHRCFSVFENNFGTFFQDFLYLFTIISCYFVLHVAMWNHLNRRKVNEKGYLDLPPPLFWYTAYVYILAFLSILLPSTLEKYLRINYFFPISMERQS